MNLKLLTDTKLLESGDQLVSEERDNLILVLRHLEEVNSRRLYSALGFKSLHRFACDRWKYSGDQGYRRIVAMKLLRDIPEIENYLKSGGITLSHLSVANSAFKLEARTTDRVITRDEKWDLINNLFGLSVRQAERVAANFLTKPPPPIPDAIKITPNDQVEISFSAHMSVEAKVNELKGLLAHSNPNINLGELFSLLCDVGINKFRARKYGINLNQSATNAKPENKQKSRAKIRSDVFREAENKCENCGSGYALEIDHKDPQGKGGSSLRENLRVLCRPCNQRAAIEVYGPEKMEPFLNP